MQVRYSSVCFVRLTVFTVRIFSDSPKPQAGGGPPLIGCPPYFFNIFAATPHNAGRSSFLNLRKRHAVLTGTAGSGFKSKTAPNVSISTCWCQLHTLINSVQHNSFNNKTVKLPMYTYIYLYIPTLNTSPAAVQSYCSNLTAAVHSNRMLLQCSSADMQFALCRLYYTVLQNRNDVQVSLLF